MRGCRLVLSFALVVAGAKGMADEKSVAVSPTATPKSAPVKAGKDKEVPVIGVSHAVEAPRDISTGQATGRRVHKPLLLHEEGFELVDGRYFVLDKTTGKVRFGDGEDGKTPAGDKVLDGTYRTGAGRTLIVRNGKLVDVPTPVPTASTAKKDAAKMTIKFKPELTRITVGGGDAPTPSPPPK